jgi:uncharacterized membrane protein YdjX (TVP38/TMEM64 family)
MSHDAPQPPAGPPPLPYGRGALLLFGLLLAAVVVVYFTPLQEHLRRVREVKDALHACGPMGRAVFALAVFALVALGTPRLLFCPIGGMAFGFAEGLAWTQLATLLGYYATFLFVRWGGRERVLRRHPGIAHAHEVLGVHPVLNLFLIRQLPISGLLVNLFMGVTRIRHRHFLIGTLLGLLPEAIPLTLVGSSAGKFDPRTTLAYIGGGVAALAVVLVGSWFLARHSRVFAALRGEIASLEAEEKRAPR